MAEQWAGPVECDYRVACIERADADLPSPIHADDDRVVRCDCFEAIPEEGDSE